MIYRFTICAEEAEGLAARDGALRAQGYVRAKDEAEARAMLGAGASVTPQPGVIWPGAVGASLHICAGKHQPNAYFLAGRMAARGQSVGLR